jgi:hypothetical protein
MGPMTNTNIGNNGYGNEMDVTQLPGLESPASISSNDMPNSNNSGETVAPQILGVMDCAEAQSQRTYINMARIHFASYLLNYYLIVQS